MFVPFASSMEQAPVALANFNREFANFKREFTNSKREFTEFKQTFAEFDGFQNRKFWWGLSKQASLVHQQFWYPFGWFFGPQKGIKTDGFQSGKFWKPSTDLFLRSFREGISFPNFVERSMLRLPFSKLQVVPLALQNRALFEEEKRAKRCREKGRKRAGQQKGRKGKKDE